jgi:hypothetical protein
MSGTVQRLVHVTLVIAALAGCHRGPAQIRIPSVNASSAASAALALADKDGDGAISKDESVATPSLKYAFDKYDADKNGRIDASEIESRIESWTAHGAMVMPTGFYVKMDGRPLANAKVVLEPEPFMGGVLPPGEGVVDSTGACGPTVPKELLSKAIPAGMFCGLYQIKITSSEKTIPAKYNERTELGFEVAPDYSLFSKPTIELSSR